MIVMITTLTIQTPSDHKWSEWRSSWWYYFSQKLKVSGWSWWWMASVQSHCCVEQTEKMPPYLGFIDIVLFLEEVWHSLPCGQWLIHLKEMIRNISQTFANLRPRKSTRRNSFVNFLPILHNLTSLIMPKSSHYSVCFDWKEVYIGYLISMQDEDKQEEKYI